MTARQATVDEVLTAARERRLFERGDETMSWYAIDGEHIGLDPVQSLIGHGVLGLALDDCTTYPRAIYLRGRCHNPRIDRHDIGGVSREIVKVRGGVFAIDGEIYRRTGE